MHRRVRSVSLTGRRGRNRAATWAAMTMMLCAALAAAGCGATTTGAAQATHVVTDMSGDKVVVPDTVTRIAEQFPAHTVTDIMLGVGSKLDAIPQNVSTIPFLQAVDPGIVKVPQLFSSTGSVNMEKLLALNTSVVSATGGGAALAPFKSAGLPAVNMTFSTISQLPKSITLAGQVYGGSAVAKAAAFNKYYAANLQLVTSRTASLPASSKPSVLHIASYENGQLIIDGPGTIMDGWIKAAGGTDAAAPLTAAGSSTQYSHVTITAEQLLQWNPDFIDIETPGGDQGLASSYGSSVAAALTKLPGWSSLKAVKDNNVYINPQGMYPWDRFTPEDALQLLWAAKVLHPSLFADISMRTEAANFYKTFFNYTPSAVQLDQILQTTAASGIATPSNALTAAP
jgi:iron complex transport system substrate-binding protein